MNRPMNGLCRDRFRVQLFAPSDHRYCEWNDAEVLILLPGYGSGQIFRGHRGGDERERAFAPRPQIRLGLILLRLVGDDCPHFPVSAA